jgi:hypothetical protein
MWNTPPFTDLMGMSTTTVRSGLVTCSKAAVVAPTDSITVRAGPAIWPSARVTTPSPTT